MANKIAIYDGYGIPTLAAFDGRRRKKRRSKSRRKGGPARMKAKMRSCAAKWRRSSKSGKYTSFMSRCLKSR